MALAPKGHGKGFRDSVKFFLPSSIDDRLEEPQLSDKELRELELFGQEATAELAAKEAKEDEAWAAETFPIVAGYTAAELDVLEDRLKAFERGGSAVVIRSKRGFQSKQLHNHRDTYEEEGDIYRRIGRALTPGIIEDPDKFGAVLPSFHSYLAWAKRERHDVLMAAAFAGSIAELILPLYNRYMNSSKENVAVGSRRRFSMLLSDITRAIPGVVHELNVLLLASAGANINCYAHSGNGSGNGVQEPVHAGRHKPPFVKPAYASVTHIGGNGGRNGHNHQQVYVNVSAELPRKLGNLLNRVKPSLPGIM